MVKGCYKRMFKSILPLVLFLLPTVVLGECTCDATAEEAATGNQPLRYRIASIFTILCAGGIGVSLPLIGKNYQALNPDNDSFFIVKAFAAGVILATGFIHVLPDAFDNLTSPCLNQNPWGNFPFTGFIAMMAAIGTLLVDTYATSFYQRLHFNKQKERAVVHDSDIEGNRNADSDEHAGHVHVHSHATDGHGHAHGSIMLSHDSILIRQRVISQVLELGIIAHSVVIGISLGVSHNLSTIKSLLAALSFHQFFEGLGLGGCISQAKFESLSTVMMAVFFSLTTPVGIAIGIGVSSVYKENSPKALIVEGVLNSASSGILIYMALVDLLAADFMNPRMQTNSRLQLGANISLLLGAAFMSVLAIWA